MDQLLQDYRRLAIAYGEASEARNPRASNTAHDQLVALKRHLRDLGQEGRILEYLDDPSEHVRLWAGFDALYLAPEDGLRVLRALEQRTQELVGFNASSILQEWNSGDLVLFPWTDERE